MEEKITLCGDNCIACPRYNAHSDENNVKKLIAGARENGVEVIYVRHDDGAGAELTKGTEGFEIYEGFKPEQDEVIFDNDFMSSEASYKYYNEFIWKDRYAECISVEETIHRMKNELTC